MKFLLALAVLGMAAKPSEFKSATSPELNPNGTAFMAPGQLREDKQIFDRSIILRTGGRWPDVTKISQCWVNPEEAGEIVADLQQWLSAEYRRAGIGFVFEGKCSGVKKNQIRTYFKRDHSWAGTGLTYAGGGLSWLGPISDALGGVEGTGTMNIMVGKDVVGYGKSAYRDFIVENTRATAVHEFGHALGLAHEQERNDAPICQDQKGKLPNYGDYLFVGQYDPNSVMNYCKTGAGVASLSAGDIVGLTTLYPMKAGVTVGTNVCTDTTTTTAAPLSQPPGSYLIKPRTSLKCIEPLGGQTAAQTQLGAEACNGRVTQAYIWKATSGAYFTLQEASSKRCIDIDGGSKNDGAKAQLYDCNGTAAQEFIFEARGSNWNAIVNKNSKLCLTMDERKGVMTQSKCTANGSTQSLGFFPVETPSLAVYPKSIGGKL